MPKDESLNELWSKYDEMKSRFDETNQNAIRDKRSDYLMIPQDELSKTLNSKISSWQKRKLLHTQIGYLRINIFHEYYAQIGRLQQKKEFNKAAELMNKYAEAIAIPFVQNRKQLPVVRFLGKVFRLEVPFNPFDAVCAWRANYESWLRQWSSLQPKKALEERSEEFQKLLTAFFTLYTYSFSVSNFPPLTQRRTDR